MRLPYVLLTLGYCVGIFIMSASPMPVELPENIPNLDKIIHGFLYAGLAAVVSLGIRRSGREVANMVQFAFPVLFVTMYGASDEFHQYFVPGRHADVFDLMADTVGALVMQVVLCQYVWAIWREERAVQR